MFPITRSVSPFRHVAVSPQKVLSLKISYKAQKHPRVCYSSTSQYMIHPEKLQQLTKEKDAQNLCTVLASEEYRNRLKEVVEDQDTHLSDASVSGEKARYQHVISCAQPIRKYVEEDEEAEPSRPPPLRSSKSNKPKGKLSIISVMMKKKQLKETGVSGETQNHQKSFYPLSYKPPVRKVRKRATILPIFLKKKQVGKTQNEYWPKLRNEEREDRPKEEISTGESSNVEERRTRETRNFTTFTLKNRDTDSTTSVNRKSRMKRRRRPVSKKMETVTRTCEMNLPIDIYCQVDEGLTDIVKTEHLQKRKMSTYRFYPLRHEFVQDTLALYERVRKGSLNKELEAVDDSKYETPLSKTLEKAKQTSSHTYIAVSGMNKKRQDLYNKVYSSYSIM